MQTTKTGFPAETALTRNSSRNNGGNAAIQNKLPDIMTGFIESILLDMFLVFFPLIALYDGKNLLAKKAFHELGFKKMPLPEMAKKSLIILGALVLLAIATVYLASLAQVNDLEKVADSIKATRKASPFILAYLLVVRVFSEEVFFRGFLVPKLGVFPSALIFGIGHIFLGSWIEVAGAFVLGIVLGLFFQKNKNIFPNIIAHFLYNLIALVVFFGITG